jgi:hypothetical protein
VVRVRHGGCALAHSGRTHEDGRETRALCVTAATPGKAIEI